MPELERMLGELGSELDWPRTPELGARVSARIAGPAGASKRAGRRPPLLRGARRSLAIALAVLLVLAAAAVAAVPGVRDAVLELFGLQGATVERVESLPTPPPERPLDLGRRTSLAGARERLAFEPLLPADPGAPDAVYVRTGVPGGELSLAYRARAGLPRAGTTRLGLLVSQFRGDLQPEYVGKIAGPDVQVERLRVDGDRALWIEGAPHFFFYRGPDGRMLERELRLARNVLLIERGRLLVRLEGAFSRARALEIARSLR
jgi:hypothetical protein